MEIVLALGFSWVYRKSSNPQEQDHEVERKRMNLQEKVKGIICDQLAVEADNVTDTASFIDYLDADSLDIVELVMTMEEEFELDIPDEDAEKMRTVGDVIKYIESKQKS